MLDGHESGQNTEAPVVGAPSELADAEEVPGWFADIFKALSAGPLLIGLVCGGLPVGCAILGCIASLFL